MGPVKSTANQGEYEEFVLHSRSESGVMLALFRQRDKGLRLAKVVVPADADGYVELDHQQTVDRLARCRSNGWPCEQTTRALNAWPKPFACN